MNVEDIKPGELYLYRWSSEDGWHFRNYVCRVVRITPTGRVSIAYDIKTPAGLVTKTATVMPRKLMPREASKSGASRE